MDGMSSAVAMINLTGEDVIVLDRLDSDLVCRISLPWLSSIPVTRKRIAVVVEPVNVLQTRRRWECAAALGVDLVVISTGDWFPDSHELRYLREGFIVADITPNAGLATRIVDAVRSYPSPIDGIYTTSHHWLIAVADAAEILGLPTAPATAYRIACDKSETRALEPGDASVLVSGVEDLNSRAELRESLRYPVVVKPVNSDGSECVFKVPDVTELEAAVVRAAGHRNSGRVLIEPYIDGPEFDVNLVLCDGEVVFCEVSDDFPSAADHQSSLGFDAPHFGETRVVMPSVLPAREQTLIEQSMGASVRRQGFRHGVFHVEGRVRQSSVRFQQLDDDLGSLDLRPAKVAPDSETSEPLVYLHEVNARPPGYNSCTSSLVTYGVDYWALQILCAVEDWQRVGMLSQGFIGGAQGAAMVMNAVVAVDVSLVKQIHPEIDPVTISRRLPVGPMDPMGELRQTHPSLTQSVVQSIAVLSSGRSYGNQASTWWWLATFLLFASRREDILLIGEDLTRKYESIVHRANATARYRMPGTVGKTKC
ncbi:hypothetical protein CNMCM6805_000157 [Aspergillus fumigatiaffinis]|uniref:ATP-grasp domain-containing protein n=1 Tax=Aspergillus fumigatiaffinis TaxID=340414 RepID=A0A8H4M672_9EURO|nr:hypothetical protein CNMCM6805_000157 [Aspergillus fumigatiaffinis]